MYMGALIASLLQYTYTYMIYENWLFYISQMVDEHRLNVTQCSQNIYVQHIKSLQVQHVPRLEEMLIVTDTNMEVKSFMDFTCTRILLLIFLSEPTVLLTASSANLLQINLFTLVGCNVSFWHNTCYGMQHHGIIPLFSCWTTSTTTCMHTHVHRYKGGSILFSDTHNMWNSRILHIFVYNLFRYSNQH